MVSFTFIALDEFIAFIALIYQLNSCGDGGLNKSVQSVKICVKKWLSGGGDNFAIFILQFTMERSD